MKTQILTLKSFSLLIVMLLILGCLGCSKEDNLSDTNEGDGELLETPGQITEDDFEAFEGEIGIALDARPIARKGYTPTQVTINVDATHGDYTQTIPLDEFSYMGQLKVSMEGLSDEAKNELINGVDITPVYKDANGNTIFTDQTYTMSFQSNPSMRSANAIALEETVNNQTLTFVPESPYYIQRMNADGSPGSGTFTTTSNPDLGNVVSATESTWEGNEASRSFTFHELPGEMNTFAIRHKESLAYISYSIVYINTNNYEGSHFGLKLTNRTNLTEIQGDPDYDNFKFKIERQGNGIFKIKNHLGQTLKQVDGFGLTFDDNVTNIAGSDTVVITATERSWRMISRSIDWTIMNIGTTFLEPVLPPAQTSLSSNSILTNCGNGTLTQTIGNTVTETQDISVGFEETLSMSTSNSINVGFSVNVEFSAQILGVGTNVNTTAETSYEHSWSHTQTNSNWGSTHAGESLQISTQRVVTVPSGSASLVYDVFQMYPETRINFVQKMRIDGYDTSIQESLSGEQIRTQFYLSGFNGVVTAVEDNSIVISLRGTLTLDRILESESTVQDVPANCN